MGLLMLVAAAWAATCPQRLPAEYADDEESSDRVILILKAEHMLGVYEGDTLVAGTCFTARFGGWLLPATATEPRRAVSAATLGPKLRRGDKRTPEGWYAISHQNAGSRYYLSLGINYPNFDDVMRAREEGVIDHATGNVLADAINDGRLPRQNTVLGGDIFIHGNPNGYVNDWTDGCVAVSNAGMDRIYDLGIPGTAVLILPSLNEKSAEP